MKRDTIYIQQARVAILAARGLPIAVIANTLFISVNTANALLRRARLKLGEDYVSFRPKEGIPQKRPPCVLDALTEPGQQIRATIEEAGRRSNIHQNAETRGWAVRVEKDGDGAWLITAVRRIPPRLTRITQRKAKAE